MSYMNKDVKGKEKTEDISFIPQRGKVRRAPAPQMHKITLSLNTWTQAWVKSQSPPHQREDRPLGRPEIKPK